MTERSALIEVRTLWRVSLMVAAVGAMLAGAPGVAHAQKSPSALAALSRAQHDLVTNDFTDAATEMETAVRFEPRFAFGWYLLASTSRRAGDYDRAVAAYRRYLDLRPTEPDPLFGIGLCLEAVGDRDGALASLKRYLELDTRPASAEFIAQAEKKIAALEKAKAADAAAAKIPAKGRVTTGAGGGTLASSGAGGAPATGHAAVGTELVIAHKSEEAAGELQAAVKEAPADAAAWYKLAFALRQSGKLAEAAKAYRRYITLKPDDPDPYYGFGQVLLALGRPDEALTTFRTYVKLEHRKSEQRWVTKARAEVIRLEAARKPAAPTEPKPLAPKSAAITSPTAPPSPATPTSPPPAH